MTCLLKKPETAWIKGIGITRLGRRNQSRLAKVAACGRRALQRIGDRVGRARRPPALSGEVMRMIVEASLFTALLMAALLIGFGFMVIAAA